MLGLRDKPVGNFNIQTRQNYLSLSSEQLKALT